MKHLTRCLLYYFVLMLPILAFANPIVDDAKRQLALLPTSGEKNKILRENYLQIIETYSQIEQTKLRDDEFKIQLKKLPSEIARLELQLNESQGAREKPNSTQQTIIKKVVLKAPLATLELALTQLQSSQLELQQKRSQLENLISIDSEKPAILRKSLSSLKQLPNDLTKNNSPKKQQQLTEALFSLKNIKAKSINLELLVIPLSSEYNRLKLSLITIELTALNQKIRYYQDKIQLKRQSATDRFLNKITPIHPNKENPAPIRQLIAQNKTLIGQLRTSVINTASALERRRNLEQQHNVIQQSYKIIQQQFSLSKNSFGVELINFKHRFAKVHINNDINTEIARIKLSDIELNQLMLDLTINIPETSSWDKESLADLKSVQNTTLDLINSLHVAFARELEELSKIHGLEKEIGKLFKQGDKLLNKYLIWLPSVPTVDSEWFTQIHKSARAQLQQAFLFINQIALHPAQQWMSSIFVLFLVTCLALLLRRYQQRHEKVWSLKIGNVVNDRFNHTLQLFLLAPAISLPIPLFICILLNQMIIIEDFDTQWTNILLGISAWIYLSLMYWLKRPYGLFISHLDFHEDICITLKKLISLLYFTCAPLTWLLMYFERIPSLDLHSGLERLVFIVVTILAGGFWAVLCRGLAQEDNSNEGTRTWSLPKPLLILLVLMHLILIFTALAGYLFTSSGVMSVSLGGSLVLGIVFLIYRLGLRWLLIVERRISFTKIRARRIEILAARENNEEIPFLEENYLGVKSISEQASVLLKALSFGLLFFALWFLVKNFLPSLDIFDNIILWRNDITTASGITSESISLRNVITSGFLIGLTILAVYNLPGLLELLVLRHMKLTPGTSYAITSITRYLLIIASVIAGASQIGVEWAKLQWLVAAMGVGLGFGLQEIVANFVSGIIILFEKPVRIGDTITIGGVTGKVTKIKIRATTISDWDRKEVIIPNKTFVTDQLINWSLSDAITRVIMHVKVAYGSDTALVHQLMQQAAISNNRVLSSPAPEVFFTTFGNSTLDFELRFFVESLGDRNLAVHEINEQINQVFKEQNISIAFSQLDVHLHRSKN